MALQAKGATMGLNLKHYVSRPRVGSEEFYSNGSKMA